MKKQRLFAVAVLALLTVLALIAAACNAAGAAFYTVTLNYEASQGEISLAPSSEDGKYAEGTQLTLTVTPHEGFEVASFTVSGDAGAALDEDGKYAFQIQADTTVTAAFRETTPPPAAETCLLTLVFDQTQGDVSVSPAAPEGGYEAGTQLTLTVTPHEGFEVASFTVSGDADAALDEDGKYAFQIQTDTTLTAVFGPAAAQPAIDEALAALQGSVLFEGKFINHDYGFDEEIVMDFSVLFDAAAKAIWQTEKDGGAYSFNAVYADDGGKVSLVTHDEEGKAVFNKSTDDFADYFNPFALLTPADFTQAEDSVWELALEKADAAATAITGYEDTIASFRLTLEEGAFTKLQIKTKRVVNAQQGIDFEYEYLYDIKQAGTAKIPAEWLTDYPMTAEHEALKAALEKAASASSYTVSEHKVELGQASEDVDATLYVTQDAIYEDAAGWENGYTVSQGAVYPFDYDPETETAVFGGALSVGSIDKLKAIFTFVGFSYSLMGYDGDGQYSVRIPDLFIMDEPGTLAGAVASLFAVGTDRIQLYPYALDCTIVLKEGELYQVSFTYDYWGAISEQVTLTFSAFGSTELPIEIVGEPAPSEIPAEYFGVFKGEKDGTAYEIEIAAEGITVTIGGTSYTAEIEAYDEYEGFTITVDGTTYYLSSMDYEAPIDQLMFMTEDYSLMVSLTRESGAEEPEPEPSGSEIPAEYFGVFKGEKDGTAYEVEIAAEGITVTIGGTSYTAEIEAYDEYEGFTITVDGTTYYLSSMDYEAPIDQLMLMTEDYSLHVSLTRESGAEEPEPEPSGSEIPAEYFGVFKGEKDGTAYEIEIAAEGITVTIGGTSYTAEIEAYDEYEGFTLTVDGTTYYLSSMDYEAPIDQLMFMTEDYSLMVTLTREGAAA